MDVTIQGHETHNPAYDIAQAYIGVDKETLLCASRHIETGDYVYEVYKGENYIPHSTNRSWSRSYTEFNKIPGKYQLELDLLKNVVEQYATGKKIGKFFNV